jgi:hypothetical protein
MGQPQVIDQSFDRFDLRPGPDGIHRPVAMWMFRYAVNPDLTNPTAPFMLGSAMITHEARDHEVA